jgi:hypothetical protein
MFAVRVGLVWLHAAPNYFPDEYLYSTLGRSLAGFDGPTVRGASAHFPALLQPLLTAGAWRVGNVETAFRLVQVVQAAAFTLAAVPAYLIARRLQVGRGLALAVGAGALLVPDALYAGFVLAEPIAYPLALTAVFFGISALERPRARTQWLFLACSALAAFGRLQLAVLPLCFAFAALAIGLRERRLREVLREQRLPFAIGAVAVAGLVAAVAVRGLGYYAGARHLHFDVVSIGRNLTILFYAGGWAVVPGALVGIWACVVRPRSRAESAFGWLTVCFGAALVLEAAVWGDTSLVQERYLVYLLPLGLVAFCVQAARGWPLRRVQAGLGAGLLLLSARVPLSGWAVPGSDDHSPFLLAVERLQFGLGTSTGAFVVATAAALLSLAAVLGSWRRPRLAAPVLLGLALAASAASLAGVTVLDHENSLRLLHRYLPADRSWVDSARLGPATLLEAAGNRPTDGEEQLFWNRSLQRVAVLPGGGPPDRLAATSVSIDSHGVVRSHGRALRGPLVVDGYASTVQPAYARLVARAPHDALVLPHGPARLRLYVLGRSADGLLVGSRGVLLFWTDRPGVLTFRVSGRDVQVGGRHVHGSAIVRLPVCHTGRFAAGITTTIDRIIAGRPAGGRMSLPRFTPGRCRG